MLRAYVESSCRKAGSLSNVMIGRASTVEKLSKSPNGTRLYQRRKGRAQPLIYAWGRGQSSFPQKNENTSKATKRVAIASPNRKSSLPFTPPSSNTVLSWTFVASMLAISVASMSLARNYFKAFYQKKTSDLKDIPPNPLSSEEEAALGALSPMLLAAETGAHIDETATMSMEELKELDGNLRMLITSMDSQLMELQDEMMTALPPEATEAFNTIFDKLQQVEEKLSTSPEGEEESVELGRRLTDLQWKAFDVLQPYAPDDTKRSFRSLLANRSIQAALLRQVERQVALRAKMAAVEAQIHNKLDTRSPNTTSIKSLVLQTGGFSVPHPRKADTGGEDAFFTSDAACSMGVADGVGGWASEGIDPAEYPRKLIEACKNGAEALHGDPLIILKQAHAQAHAPGSCTVAIACLDGPHHCVKIASLGDCGVRILRNSEIVFASEIQEHKFNQPYQLASPRYYVSDVPSDAITYRFAVELGDVIIMGSDGLWDNIWEDELVEMISKSIANGDDAESMAKVVAKRAAINAQDEDYISPYAAEKHEKLMPTLLKTLVRPRGGKLDDVTVVVGLVGSSTS